MAKDAVGKLRAENKAPRKGKVRLLLYVDKRRLEKLLRAVPRRWAGTSFYTFASGCFSTTQSQETFLQGQHFWGLQRQRMSLEPPPVPLWVKSRMFTSPFHTP
jgi:hypothetical protein